MTSNTECDLGTKLKRIKLLISDVDGVFTDGSFYINGSGKEYKKFSAKDGLGIGLLQSVDFPVAIISGKHSEATTYRMNELGIKEDVFQGQLDKIEAFNVIKDKYDLQNDEIAYIGDDLIDIPILEQVGAPFCVPDACEEVKNYCCYITKKKGGNGAVREIIDLILKTQQKYSEALQKLKNKKTEE